MLLNLVHERENEKNSASTFYKASITLSHNQIKIHKKLNCRQVHFNEYTQKISCKTIQQYIKNTIYHDQVVFIAEMQGQFNIQIIKCYKFHKCIQRQKSHGYHINNYRNRFLKNPIAFHVKSPEVLGWPTTPGHVTCPGVWLTSLKHSICRETLSLLTKGINFK